MGRIGGLLGLCFIGAMTGSNVDALSWLGTIGLVSLVLVSFLAAIKAQAGVESAIALGLDESGTVDTGHREASPQPGGEPARPSLRTDGRRSSPPLHA